MKSRLQQRIEAGEGVTGFFAPADSGEDFATPGILHWSTAAGATLELAERSDPWPTRFDQSFVVHGSPHDGDPITLFDARVRSLSGFEQQTFRLSASTLAIGALVDRDTRWSRANYRPGTLHEWRPETGLSIDHPDDDGRRLVVEWKPPDREVVNLPDGEVSIYPSHQTAWSYAPDWTIRTLMTFGVQPTQPITMDELWRQFGNPLLAFSMFAADVPDDLAYESYYEPAEEKQIIVLREGRQPAVRDWRPNPGHLLFRAPDLPDVAEALRAWFRIWGSSVPALGLLAEVIAQGRTYSAPRFLTLYTAAEGYWKGAWRSAEGGPWNISRLVEHAGVSTAVTGCTKDAVALLGETRNYHAHLGTPSHHSVEQIVEQTYESTRRLHALLQAALLRDLGVAAAKAEELLNAHYRSWPVP